MIAYILYPALPNLVDGFGFLVSLGKSQPPKAIPPATRRPVVRSGLYFVCTKGVIHEKQTYNSCNGISNGMSVPPVGTGVLFSGIPKLSATGNEVSCD